MKLQTVVDGHTYEGLVSVTPRARVRVLLVRGPLEWKPPRVMRGLYDLEADEWHKRPGRANGGGRYQKEFFRAGRQLIEMAEANRQEVRNFAFDVLDALGYDFDADPAKVGERSL